MKITKRHLRRIIKEEKAKLLNEYTPEDVSGSGPYSGPENILEELTMLEEVRGMLLQAGRDLPSPMDVRIEDAVELISEAIDRLNGI